MVFTIMPFSGEGTVSYSYVRARFNWGVDEYSYYRSVISAAGLIAQAILIPLIALLKLNEAMIMTVIFVTIMARHMIHGFASHPWMYYLGALVDIIGSYSFAIIRSMVSTCVAPTELGKVYALLSSFDSLLPIGISQLYTTIFKVK